MKVRLTRKHAEQIDGIDLSGHEVGDTLDLPTDQARLIVAEDWAHHDRRSHSVATEHKRRADDRSVTKRSKSPKDERNASAADRPNRTRKPLR